MDLHQLSNLTVPWVDAWLHGNAQPRVVLDALRRLHERAAADPPALAIVDRARRVVTRTPFGSVQQTFAA